MLDAYFPPLTTKNGATEVHETSLARLGWLGMILPCPNVTRAHFPLRFAGCQVVQTFAWSLPLRLIIHSAGLEHPLCDANATTFTV